MEGTPVKAARSAVLLSLYICTLIFALLLEKDFRTNIKNDVSHVVPMRNFNRLGRSYF